MALIKCPECGRENVSDSAESCPGCGYPFKDHSNNSEKQLDSNSNIKFNFKRKGLFFVLGSGIVAITLILFIINNILNTNKFYDLSEKTIGQKVTQNEVEKYIKGDSYNYYYDILEYRYKSGNKNIKRSVIFEDNNEDNNEDNSSSFTITTLDPQQFPTTIIGVAENYGYTYGTMLPGRDTYMCSSADECKKLGETQFEKELDKTIKKYGDDYEYEQTEIGYGMRINYKWYLNNGIYYSLSLDEGSNYYPEFNQYSISYGYFSD